MTTGDSPQKRTNWELIVLACMFVGYMAFIFARTALPVASPEMLKDSSLGLDEASYGDIAAWGTAGMIAGKLFTGVIADWFGGCFRGADEPVLLAPSPHERFTGLFGDRFSASAGQRDSHYSPPGGCGCATTAGWIAGGCGGCGGCCGCATIAGWIVGGAGVAIGGCWIAGSTGWTRAGCAGTTCGAPGFWGACC